MMNALIALGLGIIVFALIVATGLIVISQFGVATANCPSGFTYNSNGTKTFTTNTCCMNNGTANPDCLGAINSTGASKATDTTNTIMGYMQTNLVTWIPAVIALGVGLLFIGALMGKKNKY